MKPLQTCIKLNTSSTTVRNERDDIINQIVAQTDAHGKKATELKKLIALTANTLKWDMTALHVLLKKRQDPTIKNYSAFVRWSIRLNNKSSEV